MSTLEAEVMVEATEAAGRAHASWHPCSSTVAGCCCKSVIGRMTIHLSVPGAAPGYALCGLM